MSRPFWVVVHRWVGLVMTVFLVIAGLTGSLLVWNHELDRAVWPVLRKVTPPRPGAQPLDPFELHEIVRRTIPETESDEIYLTNHLGRDYPVLFGLRAPAISKTSSDDELYVDPYTGLELGRRKWGDITQGRKNLMPFLYRLHYSLGLDTVGMYIFGVIALLWTIDCFVGAYLTFPRRGPFFEKWKPAWGVKTRRLTYDLHRAGGLWPWAMLFVLAWSAVGFNLREVYSPVMKTFFTFSDDWAEVPDLKTPQPSPGLSLMEARAIGQRLAAEEGRRLGFTTHREDWIFYQPTKGMYRYGVTSDRDISNHGGGTQIWFDANTGARLRTVLPSGQRSGNTVSNWLFSLHMATVWGLPFRIFLSVVGVVLAMLSVTGTMIWWRKHQQRRLATRRAAAARGTPCPKLGQEDVATG